MRTRFVTLIVILAGLASTALAGDSSDGARTAHSNGRAPSQAGLDWNQFMGPHRNGTNETGPLLSQWPAEGPEVVWKVPCATGHAGPVVADGILILLERDKPDDAKEVIRALDAESGTELWRRSYPCVWPAKRGHTHGPAATPAVSAGKVVWLGIEAKLRCHDLHTGELIWQKDLVQEYQFPPEGDETWGAVTSPLVYEDRLIVQVSAGEVGLVAWRFADGEELWRTPVFKNYACSPGFTEAFGKPVVLGLAVTRVPSMGNGDLWGFDARDGKMLWAVNTGKSYYNCPSPVPGGGFVFVEGGGGDGPTVAVRLPATEDDKPEVAWTEPHLVRFSHYLYYGGLLFGQGYQAHGSPHMFFCIEPTTGRLLFEKRVDEDHAWLLGSDGKVLHLHENGDLSLFDAEGGRGLESDATPADVAAVEWRLVELARATVIDKTWSYPALAGGRLYVRSDTQVLCLALRDPNRAK